jgi:restriction system protein
MAQAGNRNILKKLSRATQRLLGLRRAHPEPMLPGGVALIEGMGWNEFELLAVEGFRSRGYVVSETGGGGGRAVDMVLTRGVERFLVDCKPWRSTVVGVAPLRQLVGVMKVRNADGGFVLSSGTFTAEAVRFGADHRIQLIDGSKLRDLLHSREEKTLPVVVRRQAPFADSNMPSEPWRLINPTCPLCGGSMVERVQATGPLAGQQVLGCIHYPLCNGTRELNPAADRDGQKS